MPLLLTLGRGALTGIGKKPSARAALPGLRPTAPQVRIDPARLARYAQVCGYPQGGGPGPAVLPLTYPHILGFPLAARIMAARDFPLPLMGLVHTSIEISSRRPLTVEDRPDIAVHARELRPHRRGTEVVLVTEARVGGQESPVWTDHSTYLARHPVDGPPPTPTTPATEDSGDSEDSEDSEELPEVEEWRLPADLGRRHARVSGDYNPIHLHPLTARPLGFPRAIAHGMWTVARCVAAIGSAGYVRAEFRAPVPLPSTVTLAAAAPRFELRSPHGLHLTGTTRVP